MNGGELLAACVEANVRSAAFTTNALIAGIEQERDSLARGLARLYDALDGLPDTVRTVAIERMLTAASPYRDAAARYLSSDLS